MYRGSLLARPFAPRIWVTHEKSEFCSACWTVDVVVPIWTYCTALHFVFGPGPVSDVLQRLRTLDTVNLRGFFSPPTSDGPDRDPLRALPRQGSRVPKSLRRSCARAVDGMPTLGCHGATCESLHSCATRSDVQESCAFTSGYFLRLSLSLRPRPKCHLLPRRAALQVGPRCSVFSSPRRGLARRVGSGLKSSHFG